MSLDVGVWHLLPPPPPLPSPRRSTANDVAARKDGRPDGLLSEAPLGEPLPLDEAPLGEPPPLDEAPLGELPPLDEAPPETSLGEAPLSIVIASDYVGEGGNALQTHQCSAAILVPMRLSVQWFLAALAAVAADAYFTAPEVAAGTALMVTGFVLAACHHALWVGRCCRYCRAWRAATHPQRFDGFEESGVYVARLKIWFEAAATGYCAGFAEGAAIIIRVAVEGTTVDHGRRSVYYAAYAAAAALALATFSCWCLEVYLRDRRMTGHFAPRMPRVPIAASQPALAPVHAPL